MSAFELSGPFSARRSVTVGLEATEVANTQKRGFRWLPTKGVKEQPPPPDRLDPLILVAGLVAEVDLVSHHAVARLTHAL